MANRNPLSRAQEGQTEQRQVRPTTRRWLLHDALGYRLDNLIVALLSAWLTQRLLRRWIPKLLATSIAVCVLASPFSLLLVCVEPADLYVWLCCRGVLALQGAC